MLIRAQHDGRGGVLGGRIEGSEHTTVAIEQHRKGEVLRAHDIRGFAGDGEKPRAGGTERLVRFDKCGNRFGGRCAEPRTEQKDDRVAGDSIRANVDDRSVERRESARGSNVASRKHWNFRSIAQIVPARRGRVGLGLAQDRGSGPARSHDIAIRTSHVRSDGSEPRRRAGVRSFARARTAIAMRAVDQRRA
jgi:hypothetical protein